MKEYKISLIYIFFTALLSITFLSSGLLVTFIISIIIIMLGFYLDQNIALSFKLSIKRFATKE